MLYERKTFTVPATSGRDEDRRQFCAEKGHAASDSKGRCLCCGETVAPPRTDSEPPGGQFNTRYAIGRPPERRHWTDDVPAAVIEHAGYGPLR